MAKLENKSETAKKFIPTKVGIHNKAIDVLCLLQKCTNKINGFKKQIENVDADIELMQGVAFPDQLDIRASLVYHHDWQVIVYRRILSFYLAQISQLYHTDLFDHMYFYPQSGALKNAKAA